MAWRPTARTNGRATSITRRTAKPIRPASRSRTSAPPRCKVACCRCCARATPGRAATDAASARSRPLAEQHGLNFRILHVDALAQLEAERHAALDRRARLHGPEPAPQVGKLVDVLALPLPAIGPTDDRHVGDR